MTDKAPLLAKDVEWPAFLKAYKWNGIGGENAVEVFAVLSRHEDNTNGYWLDGIFTTRQAAEEMLDVCYARVGPNKWVMFSNQTEAQIIHWIDTYYLYPQKSDD